MMSRRWLGLAARTLIGALLFAQAALALAACDWARRAPAARAIAQAEQPSAEPACHEQQGQYVNLCVAHCLGEDQSLDKPVFPVPAFVAAPVLALPQITLAAQHGLRDSRYLPPAAGPPPRIRFQSLLL